MPLADISGGQPGTVSGEGEFLHPSCAARSPRLMALGAPASTSHRQRTAQRTWTGWIYPLHAMLGSLMRSCYYSSAKRDSVAVYRGRGHMLQLVQCRGEICLTECRSHRGLFCIFFPCQCKEAFSVPRASTPPPMPTKWLTAPPPATPSLFTPAISITCYRLLTT